MTEILLSKRDSPDRQGAELDVTAQKGRARGRRKRSRRKCMVCSKYYKKILDNQLLVGRIHQVLIHLFRLDLCSSYKNLLFQCGCVSQTLQACLKLWVTITKEARFPSLRKKPWSGS